MAYATCFLVILNSLKLETTKLEDHENDFKLIWKDSKEILNNWNSLDKNKDYDHWIYFLKKAVDRIKELGYDTTTVLENIKG